MAKESEALAVRKSTDMAALDELETILRTGVGTTQVESDPDTIAREIIAELLAAETDEELESFGAAEGWQKNLGVPYVIQGFRYRPSEYTEGPPIYMVVFANRVDDGARVVLTVGSAGVMAQLCNLAKRGRLPGAIRMCVKSDRDTKQGFRVLRLVTPDGVTNEDTAPAEASA